MLELEKSSAAIVWKYFEEISQIPRGSGNEKAGSDWIKNWAEQKGFSVFQDEANNLLVKKSGSLGYENSPAVVLQSHIDMVCEKNKNTAHNFEKDPITLLRDGDFLHADGTTLGADNGIGVAMALAVLDGDFAHPPMEALFTVGEEVGMLGVLAFDASLLSGKTILNTDSEDEGVCIAGNAGGKHTMLHLPAEWAAPDASFEFFSLELTGLHGGHSGMDIDKGRGNANRLMGRVLFALCEQFPSFTLTGIEGGFKENAIPRECSCTVGLPAGSAAKLQKLVDGLQATFAHEYQKTDAGVRLSCSGAATPPRVFSAALRDKVITALLLLPNGVQSLSADIPGLVESSNNVGVIHTTEESITFIIAIRSSVESRKQAISAQVGALCACLGAKEEVLSDYPAWEYRPSSPVRDIFVQCYKKQTGKDAVVTALHAGLECGIFSSEIEGSDILSFGPDLFDPHSPNERLSISSTERVWELLLCMLANLR